MGIPNDDTGLVTVLLRAPGDSAYGADGNATGAVAELLARRARTCCWASAGRAETSGPTGVPSSVEVAARAGG